jgi:hypothetical protein
MQKKKTLQQKMNEYNNLVANAKAGVKRFIAPQTQPSLHPPSGPPPSRSKGQGQGRGQVMSAKPKAMAAGKGKPQQQKNRLKPQSKLQGKAKTKHLPSAESSSGSRQPTPPTHAPVASWNRNKVLFVCFLSCSLMAL